MNLLLYGPPGSGKGTQAEFLRQQYSIPQVATGDMLRAESAAGTELGRRAREVMATGALMPDDVLIAIVEARLAQSDCALGFILDGFPRTTPQAQALERILDASGRRLDRVIYLKVERDVLVERLAGRLVCRTCGRSFSERHLHQGVAACPHDGTELYRREDDGEDSARTRIDVYIAETVPVLDFYRPRGLVVEVDGEGAPEDIQRRIRTVIETGQSEAVTPVSFS